MLRIQSFECVLGFIFVDQYILGYPPASSESLAKATSICILCLAADEENLASDLLAGILRQQPQGTSHRLQRERFIVVLHKRTHGPV